MWIIAKKLNILIVDTSPDYSRLRRWCFFANLFAQPPCIPWNFHPFESLLSFQIPLFYCFLHPYLLWDFIHGTGVKGAEVYQRMGGGFIVWWKWVAWQKTLYAFCDPTRFPFLQKNPSHQLLNMYTILGIADHSYCSKKLISLSIFQSDDPKVIFWLKKALYWLENRRSDS